MGVYRFGKGTPVIYIDNRLLQDNSELQRLSAADIEKVELITNPGAEYDATVKAVVRIRTVRNKRDSFGGNFRAGITQRRRSSHYGQVNLNYQKKGLSLLGMLYTNYENRKRHQEVRYQIPSEIQWDVNNRVHLYNKGLLAGGKASASYDFTPNTASVPPMSFIVPPIITAVTIRHIPSGQMKNLPITPYIPPKTCSKPTGTS